MRRSILLCLGTSLFLLATSLAQDAPKVEVFGGYSYLNADQEGFFPRQHFHGFDTNATFYIDRHVGIEGDFAAQFQSDCLGVSTLLNDVSGGVTSGVRCHYMQFMAGPKAAFRKSRLMGFGHALFGGNNVVVSTSGFDVTASVSQIKWAMAAGGGIDWQLSPRYSVRLAQADYLLTNHGAVGYGTHQNNFRISAGIVFRFGSFGEMLSHRPSKTGATMPASAAESTTKVPTHIAALGVSVVPADNQTGIEIVDVDANGPLAKAGLRAHDVIATVNGHDVRTVSDLNRAIDAAKDRQLKIRYMYLGTPQYQTIDLSY